MRSDDGHPDGYLMFCDEVMAVWDGAGVVRPRATLLHGDCLQLLHGIRSESIDLVCTDPPYGISFAGLQWDRAVPSVAVWRACYRVLKPGAFAFVFSAARADVQAQMIERLTAAGFSLRFSPLFWTYAEGMPKGDGCASVAAMRRLGDRGTIVGRREVPSMLSTRLRGHGSGPAPRRRQAIRRPTDPRALALEGSKQGCNLKPAVEVVLVAMKPPVAPTYIDQALANGKGVTWVRNARIPRGDDLLFPANLLVSDDVLGEYSAFFSLDAWAAALPPAVRHRLPFLVCKKHTRRELGDQTERHPTQKPVALMSWLVSLGSRSGDVVLDPFAGSGTTGVAAGGLGRRFIGMEQDRRWFRIAQDRLQGREVGDAASDRA